MPQWRRKYKKMDFKIDWKNFPYDFVDLGSKDGGSIEYAMKRLGGKKGLGIDIRSEYVKRAQEKGHDVIEGDATNLNLPDKCVRFTVISHFLEHLPGMAEVKKTIRNSIRISKEFVFIQGPVFDFDEYLNSLGLKTYWSDWPNGHTCHLKTRELIEVIREIGDYNYSLKYKIKIDNSDSKNIHPINSPHSQHEYDTKVHPPKKTINFDRDIFREFECLINIK